MVKQRGVSLIEMMVTLMIMVLTAVAIFPLGRAWMISQQTTKAEKILVSSYARAKNEALKNPHAVREGLPVATMKVSNSEGVIKVYGANSNNLLWESEFPKVAKIIISTGSDCKENDPKVVLDNSGQLVKGSCSMYRVGVEGAGYAEGSF